MNFPGDYRADIISSASRLEQTPTWRRRAPLTLLCTADKEQNHTYTFKGNRVPPFPATPSTRPLSAEGTWTPRLPHKPLGSHQVRLQNPAEIHLGLAEPSDLYL